jgi:transcriptional regulator with XRE-family HTH domain
MVKPTRLEELARSKGFTQEEIARQASLTLSTVRRLWQDKKYQEDPRASTLRSIARVLGVPAEALGYFEERSQLPEQRISLAGAGA